MTVIEETTRSETTSALPSEKTRSHARKAHSASLLRFAWWTVPLHVLTGFGFWWLMQHQPDQLASILLWIHVGFPCLLLLTARCWWSRCGELLALLLLNHATTFGVLICLPWG